MDMTELGITGLIGLYIFMLAAFTGYEVISRVPSILHTPLMSGSNFVHGIVLVGAIVGGLLVSQWLTLYTTPVIYLYLDRLSHWLGASRRPSRLAAALADQPRPALQETGSAAE